MSETTRSSKALSDLPARACFLRFLRSPLDNRDERGMLLLVVRGKSSYDKPNDLVQGTLDMLILKTLALEPMHGYGIAARLEQMSKGVFRPNAGSLFMAIQPLQRDGLIKGEWKSSENNRQRNSGMGKASDGNRENLGGVVN